MDVIDGSRNSKKILNVRDYHPRCLCGNCFINGEAAIKQLIVDDKTLIVCQGRNIIFKQGSKHKIVKFNNTNPYYLHLRGDDLYFGLGNELCKKKLTDTWDDTNEKGQVCFNTQDSIGALSINPCGTWAVIIDGKQLSAVSLLNPKKIEFANDFKSFNSSLEFIDNEYFVALSSDIPHLKYYHVQKGCLAKLLINTSYGFRTLCANKKFTALASGSKITVWNNADAVIEGQRPFKALMYKKMQDELFADVIIKN